MASENFIDYVKIYCKSGKGGPGASHFHREKFVAKGGPDGGDGGRGGHVILRGNAQLWTLLHLKYQKHILAEDGAKGEGGLRSGKDGKNKIIEVPLGTIARDFETGEQLAEISEDGEEYILLKGGKGGHGNNFFKSPTHQAPTHAQPGIPAKESWIILELKLLADVGLVGFPNAGKSTLFNRLIGQDASIVSDVKGTTRDYVIGRTRARQQWFECVDTAGKEWSSSPISEDAQNARVEQLELADLIIQCHAADEVPPQPVRGTPSCPRAS